MDFSLGADVNSPGWFIHNKDTAFHELACLNIQHISHYFALRVTQLFVGNQAAFHAPHRLAHRSIFHASSHFPSIHKRGSTPDSAQVIL
jgi:hypothetical protein